jgi:phage-related protein
LPARAQDKCTVRIERLAELGHELRRPEADFLRDGIYELRAKHRGVNYRMLYFFHGRIAAVVSHGFAKQRAKVPAKEIKLALKRKERFEADPKACTYEDQ